MHITKMHIHTNVCLGGMGNHITPEQRKVIFRNSSNLMPVSLETTEHAKGRQERARGHIDAVYAQKHRELVHKNNAILTERGRDRGRKVVGRLEFEVWRPFRSFRNGLITDARRVHETSQRGLDAVDNRLASIDLRRKRNQEARARLQKMTKKWRLIRHARIGLQRGVSKLEISPEKLLLQGEKKLREFDQAINRLILQGVEGNTQKRYGKEIAMLVEIEKTNAVLAEYFAEAAQNVVPNQNNLPSWTQAQANVLRRFIEDPKGVGQEWLETKAGLSPQQRNEFLDLLHSALGNNFKIVSQLEESISAQLESKGMHNYFEEKNRKHAQELVEKGKKIYHEKLSVNSLSLAVGDVTERTIHHIASQSPDTAYVICATALDAHDSRAAAKAKLQSLLIHPNGSVNQDFLDQIEHRLWKAQRNPRAISAQDLIHVERAVKDAPGELRERIMEELGNVPAKVSLGAGIDINRDFGHIDVTQDEISMAYQILMTDVVKNRKDKAGNPVSWEVKLLAARHIAQKIKQP